MERWSGRVAMVTGASSGIGAAIAKKLVLEGLDVVGLARRVEKVQELSAALKSAPGKLYAIRCDVTKRPELEAAFKWAQANLGGVDIMVNNAAAFYKGSLVDVPESNWKDMLDVNVLALSIGTKMALKSMKLKGVQDGHIIHINSIAGHHVMDEFAMYCATKHAVTALTEGLRRELVKQNSKIRVTSISPGLVKTEMPPQEFLSMFPYLEAEDIAGAVLYALGAPPHVQVHEIIIKPVGEKF